MKLICKLNNQLPTRDSGQNLENAYILPNLLYVMHVGSNVGFHSNYKMRKQ
jgi:hypothetical protein